MREFKFLFFFFLFSFIVLSQNKELTVEEIYSNSIFTPNTLSGFKWLDSDDLYTYNKLREKSIIIGNPFEKTESVLFDAEGKMNQQGTSKLNYSYYEVSPNKELLLLTGVVPARRTKSGSYFHIYSLKENKTVKSFEPKTGKLENIHFSPNGKYVSYVFNNNLFLYSIETGEEKQITNDGSKTILNGVFDWVYEEEFSIIKGYEWSQDNEKIAFWRLDQSAVPEIQIAEWDSLYFNFLTMHYPKAGTQGSLVEIKIYDVKSSLTSTVDLGNERDIYVPRIYFTPGSDELFCLRLNRLQNNLDILASNLQGNIDRVVYSETDPCWIDITDDFSFLKQEPAFLLTSEKSGYRNIYKINYKTLEETQLTDLTMEVERILSVHDDKQIVYFSAKDASPVNNVVYLLDLPTGSSVKNTRAKGVYSVNASPSGNHAFISFSTANSFPVYELRNNVGEVIKHIEQPGENIFTEYNLNEVKFKVIPTRDGISLNSFIILPDNYDNGKKYPVLIFNYSGPGSQVVVNRYGGINFLWHQLLAKKGYIIFAVDQRGAGGSGKALKNSRYKNLGFYEVNDLVDAVDYLKSLNYVDPDRIGIWGWSYGGYISALALVKEPDVFKAAISVAPVTDWKFYDNIYTERFMSTPELNPEGYKNSSVLEYAKNMKGNLFLVHGTADDNVHFQNAVVLADILIDNAIPFETMFYPGKDHGIRGGKSRIHLFNLMTNFILRNL